MKQEPIYFLIFSVVLSGALAQADFTVPQSHALGICQRTNNGQLQGARIFDVGGQRYTFTSSNQIRIMCQRLSSLTPVVPAVQPQTSGDPITQPQAPAVTSFMGGDTVTPTPVNANAPIRPEVASPPDGSSPDLTTASGPERNRTGGTVRDPNNPCNDAGLTAHIPNGQQSAPAGVSEMSLGTYRNYAVNQLMAGNIPSHLRELVPVRLAQSDGLSCMGSREPITVCRMPEPIAIGTDNDYMHTPLSITETAQVFKQWGFTIPTPTFVNASWDQADHTITGAPQGTVNMTSPSRFHSFSEVLRNQMTRAGADAGDSIAGITKQYVLTNDLSRCEGGFNAPTLYGWRRSSSGTMWQHGSTQHPGSCGNYVDYSQIPVAYSNFVPINGTWHSLTDLLADDNCARTLNRVRNGGVPVNPPILEAFDNGYAPPGGQPSPEDQRDTPTTSFVGV